MTTVNIVSATSATIGLVINLAVCAVMIANRLVRRNVTNALICNQTLLDATACLLLLITRSLELAEAIHFDDSVVARLMCWTFGGHIYVVAIMSSQAGLVVITLERFIKICHPIWHRNKYRPWMTGVGLVFPWLNGTFVSLIPGWVTRIVDNGRCIVQPAGEIAYKIYRFCLVIWQFGIPIIIFVVTF